jgi:hypothetical protein
MEPTIVSTSTGSISIAYDYSPYLERIAASLETIAFYSSTTNASLGVIANHVETLVTISTTTGIRTEGAYGWIAPVEMISWYSQGFGLDTINTTGTNQLISIINSLTSSVSKF